MERRHWDDAHLRAIGRAWAAEGYDLASELADYGVDASELLKPAGVRYAKRPPTVVLPAMLADVVMAILLALPRPAWAPDQSLGENVTALRKRA
jgi:hypothetical protein